MTVRAPAATIYDLFMEAARLEPMRAAVITPSGAVNYDEMARLAAACRDEFARGPSGRAAPLEASSTAQFLAAFLGCGGSGRPAFVHAPGARLPTGAARLTSPADGGAQGEFYWGLTSGSTGEPKIFARTHASWIASFTACEAAFPFAPQERVMIPGALSHSLFLYGAVHALARGHTAILMERFSPKILIAALARHEASVLYAVPAMLAQALTAGLESESLRRVFCGGAKLSGALRAALERKLPDADIVEFYGASELSFISYISTGFPARDGAAGRLFPGVRIAVRDAEGAALGFGEIGLIHAASPMLFSRYFGGGGPVDGWATAGDLGFLDVDGRLHLRGRLDREINAKGRKIYPEIIEAALLEHPAIEACAVVGLADEKRGQIIAAAMQLKDGCALARRELSQHCRSRLGVADCPRLYFIAAALPRTHGGKCAYAHVKRDLESGAPGYRLLA